MVHNSLGRGLAFQDDVGGALGFPGRSIFMGVEPNLDTLELGKGLLDEPRHLHVFFFELAEIMLDGSASHLFTRTTEAGVLPVL